MVPEGVSLV